MPRVGGLPTEPPPSKIINETMTGMWKKVYHYFLGICHSFDPNLGGMPNITIGKNERYLTVDSRKKFEYIWLLIHNEHDFQDGHVIQNIEKMKRGANLL